MRPTKALCGTILLLGALAAGSAAAHGLRFGFGFGFPVYPGPWYYPPPGVLLPAAVLSARGDRAASDVYRAQRRTGRAGSVTRELLVLLPGYAGLLSLRADVREHVAARLAPPAGDLIRLPA